MGKGKFYVIFSCGDGFQGIVPTWAECEAHTRGRKSVFKSYLSRSEAREALSAYREGGDIPGYGRRKGSSSSGSSPVRPFGPLLHGPVDAICFTDGSYEGPEGAEAGKRDLHNVTASFGLIILPIRPGEEDRIESGRLRDLTQTESRRTLYDRRGKEGDTTCISPPSVYQPKGKMGYIGYGMAESGEMEGCERVLEICREKAYQRIALTCDNHVVVLTMEGGLSRKLSDKPSVRRLQDFYRTCLMEGVADAEENVIDISSHNDFSPDDPYFFFGVMNDLTDVMAKAELPRVKRGKGVRAINPNLYRALTDLGEDPAPLKAIYEEGLSIERRRLMTREIYEKIAAWAHRKADHLLRREEK